MNTDPSLFFQIASALIPALLLGGSLRDLTRPGREDSPIWRIVFKDGRLSWRYAVIPLACLAIFTAEVYAIAGALGTEIGVFGTYVVATTLVTGTGALTLRVAWPWLMFALPGRSLRIRHFIVLGTSIVMLVGAVRLLSSSVDLATSRVGLNRSLTQLERSRTDLERSRADLERSRTELERVRGAVRRTDDIADRAVAAKEAEIRERLALGMLTPRQAHRRLLGLAKKRQARLVKAIEQESKAAGSP